MKIAIISDVHDNLINLQNALNIIKKEQVDTVFVLGDLGNEDSLKFLAKNFTKQIYLVIGNADIGFDEIKIKNVKIFEKIGLVRIENINFLIIHNIGQLQKNEITEETDCVFYGHTHKPWISDSKIKNDKIIKLINPGNVAGIHYDPTLATYDTSNKKLNLIKI